MPIKGACKVQVKSGKIHSQTFHNLHRKEWGGGGGMGVGGRVCGIEWGMMKEPHTFEPFFLGLMSSCCRVRLSPALKPCKS